MAEGKIPKTKSISGTKIARCSCVHPVQDQLHGKQMRVMNICKADRGTKARCTVCHSIKESFGG